MIENVNVYFVVTLFSLSLLVLGLFYLLCLVRKTIQQIDKIILLCQQIIKMNTNVHLSTGEKTDVEALFKTADGKLSYEKYREYQRRKNKGSGKVKARVPYSESVGDEIW